NIGRLKVGQPLLIFLMVVRLLVEPFVTWLATCRVRLLTGTFKSSMRAIVLTRTFKNGKMIKAC
ncbi:MAG: hypothetical protein AMS27_02425, partial [Bacteroides sp. SM23_62_1]